MAIRVRITAAVVAVWILGLGAAAWAQTNPRIAARDQLTITVWGVKEFTNRYPVGADGSLEFPEIGRVVVGGLTVREAADLLTKKLADLLVNPQVTVELEQTANKRVTINGVVRSPGVVTYAGELTLLEALVKAGGRLPEAADEVLIVRVTAMEGNGTSGTDTEGQATIEVNARELENGILSRNVALQDGDVIFVRKAQAVTVTGYVVSVGAYTIESGMNVEQVLALAGGISDRGSDRRIEISRKVDGKTVIIKAQKTDLVKPGDIIKVGRRIV